VDAEVERPTPHLDVRLLELKRRRLMLCLDLPSIDEAGEEEDEDERLDACVGIAAR